MSVMILRLQLCTRTQAENDNWFEYRRNRITESTFRKAVIKIDENGNVRNPDKCKTVISDV